MTLDRDAAYLRDLLAQERDRTADIAARLADVSEREGWSTREIAKWCKTEGLEGVTSQPYVFRLLGYHQFLTALREAELMPAGITPAERTLRPLVQAMNRGCPLDRAIEIWEYAQADKSKSVKKWLAELAPEYAPKPKPKTPTLDDLVSLAASYIEANDFEAFKEFYLRVSRDHNPDRTTMRIA